MQRPPAPLNECSTFRSIPFAPTYRPDCLPPLYLLPACRCHLYLLHGQPLPDPLISCRPGSSMSPTPLPAFLAPNLHALGLLFPSLSIYHSFCTCITFVCNTQLTCKGRGSVKRRVAMPRCCQTAAGAGAGLHERGAHSGQGL